MKKYGNLNDLLVDTNVMYEIRADGVDYLSKSIYRKIDRVIKKDFKRSYKLYLKIDKTRNKEYKKQVRANLRRLHPTLLTRFFKLFSKEEKKNK